MHTLTLRVADSRVSVQYCTQCNRQPYVGHVCPSDCLWPSFMLDKLKENFITIAALKHTNNFDWLPYWPMSTLLTAINGVVHVISCLSDFVNRQQVIEPRFSGPTMLTELPHFTSLQWTELDLTELGCTSVRVTMCDVMVSKPVPIYIRHSVSKYNTSPYSCTAWNTCLTRSGRHVAERPDAYTHPIVLQKGTRSACHVSGVPPILYQLHTYIYTYIHTYIRTYIHTYIPQIHKSVEVTTRCAISHNIQIYSYTDYRILHLNTIK
jgi:hypothetical protein